MSTSFKSKKVPSTNERESLRKWSWFLAVWGEAPPSKEGKLVGPAPADGTKPAEDSLSVDEEDDDSRWWGFANPAEIRTLAKWLAEKEGLNDKDVLAEPVSGGSSSRITLGANTNSNSKSSASSSARESADSSETRRRPSKAALKHLVKDLGDYADVLAWRIGDEKVKQSDNGDSVSGSSSKGKGRTAIGSN